MKTWESAVIGLGKIGMGFDYYCSDRSVTLTHASAYTQHPNFKLLCGVDPDCLRRKAFTKKFKLPAYGSVAEMFDTHQPEVVSLCVPTRYHFEVFNEVLAHHPLAILCEKPFSDSSVKAKKMLVKAGAKNCVVAVNYMRRCEPGVLRLKRLIDSGKLGEIYKGVVWYSKGLFNNGSHYLDLLRFFLGEVRKIEVISKGRDWRGKDPEPDCILYFRKAAVYFLAAKEEAYTFLDLELIGSRGKLQVIDVSGGNSIRYWLARRDRVYKDYIFLNDEPILINNDLEHYQWHVMNDLAGYMQGKTKTLRSTGASALITLQTMEKIARMRGGNA